LFTALAVKLDSKGPVFFIQQRVGLHKKLFPMFKFRSMVVDAEERMKEIEHLNEADGAIFKIEDDPRVTRVGRFIRRTSIDELPQLINVLLGDMSLVGPRPMSIRDVSLFDKAVQRKRFSVRPGITGLWQVSGRSDLPFDRWIELDLEYIDRWNFMADIKILFRTIPAVLKGSGAV
jgi:lipopolysaccharide/colanic/teichoic acid biosynthesis glycosyltransferase